MDVDSETAIKVLTAIMSDESLLEEFAQGYRDEEGYHDCLRGSLEYARNARAACVRAGIKQVMDKLDGRARDV